MRLARRLRSQAGSVSIVIAAILAAVVVLSLGATDLARVLTAAARAQTAADAAALAAAQELALPGDLNPVDVAREYADRNDAALLECACAVETFEAVVTVRAPVGPLLLFTDDRAVETSARAVVDLPA
ncbi:MAG: pilus assembly protein TadG-related protein [Actinomycetota bacterium]